MNNMQPQNLLLLEQQKIKQKASQLSQTYQRLLVEKATLAQNIKALQQNGATNQMVQASAEFRKYQVINANVDKIKAEHKDLTDKYNKLIAAININGGAAVTGPNVANSTVTGPNSNPNTNPTQSAAKTASNNKTNNTPTNKNAPSNNSDKKPTAKRRHAEKSPKTTSTTTNVAANKKAKEVKPVVKTEPAAKKPKISTTSKANNNNVNSSSTNLANGTAVSSAPNPTATATANANASIAKQKEDLERKNKNAYVSRSMQMASVQQTKEIISESKLNNLVTQIDPRGKLEPDVKEMLLEFADEFIDDVLKFSCLLAKHRGSTALEVKDLQLYLDRSWNINLPGYHQKASDNIKPKMTEAHKQRLALISKSIADSENQK